MVWNQNPCRLRRRLSHRCIEAALLIHSEKSKRISQSLMQLHCVRDISQIYPASWRRFSTMLVVAAVLSLTVFALSAVAWIVSSTSYGGQIHPFFGIGFYLSAGRIGVLRFGNETINGFFEAKLWVIALVCGTISTCLLVWLRRWTRCAVLPHQPGIRWWSIDIGVLMFITVMIAVTADPFGHRLGYYENSARARTLKEGMTWAEVTNLLGDPYRSQAGQYWFEPSPDGRAIRIRFDIRGRVLSFDPGVD